MKDKKFTYKLASKDKKRYWSKVSILDDNSCWEWKAGCFPCGYGQFWLCGTNVPAHRIACFLFYGDAGQNCCHTCNNILCCNPKHLYPGTPKTNSIDRSRDGHTRNGEKVNTAKLVPSQVIQIIELSNKGMTQVELSKLFKINQTCISKILRGEHWKHITSSLVDSYRKKVYGEYASHAKLKDYQVLEIYKLKGQISSSKLAEIYSVSDGAISNIWNHKTWTHLTIGKYK